MKSAPSQSRDDIAKLVVVPDVLVRTVRLRRQNDEGCVRRELILDEPNQRRDKECSFGRVKHEFLSTRTVVDHDRACAVGAREKLRAGPMSMFASNIL